MGCFWKQDTDPIGVLFSDMLQIVTRWGFLLLTKEPFGSLTDYCFRQRKWSLPILGFVDFGEDGEIYFRKLSFRSHDPKPLWGFSFDNFSVRSNLEKGGSMPSMRIDKAGVAHFPEVLRILCPHCREYALEGVGYTVVLYDAELL